MSDDDDAHNVIDAYALFFVAERTERVQRLRRERRTKEKDFSTMREQRLLLFLFHFDDENTTEGGFY